MATESRTTGFPEFLADMQSADAVGRQFIEVPLAAAQQSAIGSAAELVGLMRLLPSALVASQRRELDRLLKSSDERDPRFVTLKASIEQVEVLRTTGGQGQARLQHAVETLTVGGDVFLGFVSDVNLAPQEGLTVRLSDAKGVGVKSLSATTEADGYFSIDLGTKTSGIRSSVPLAGSMNVMQRIASLFADGGQQPAAPQPTGDRSDAKLGQVEILRNDKLLYRDPTPVVLQNGTIYREYVIPDITPSSTSGGRDVRTAAPSSLTRTPTQPTRGAKSAQPKKRK
jgi:hypothetical protein